MDILSLVHEPSWREIMLEAIQKEQMDPWDVDIAKVADAYMKQVRRMNEMDLRVPANVILASALLLHYKAQALKLEEEPEEEPETFMPLMEDEIPQLAYNPNRARARIVTLQEIMEAVEDVLKQGPRHLPRPERPMPMNVNLPKESMPDLMKKVYDRSKKLRDKENILLFSALVQSFNGHGTPAAELVSHNLIPVLHLVQDDKMLAWQDALFGEIFLKVS
ncbi:segregation/condensation protein A [Candidatus Micrarchaeota archaeon]|nr:segregation/condensation protein A [Candidatus Micrarchaeota archaeon]